jgi:hypothetical protein
MAAGAVAPVIVRIACLSVARLGTGDRIHGDVRHGDVRHDDIR